MANNINLNGKVLSALIDFELIVDMDIGLIKFIRNNFQDDRAFKLDILNKSDRYILSLLYSRTNWNPLSIISTEENLSDIDELYKSFFDTYKKEILKESITYRSINEFISMIFEAGINFGVNPILYVKDELEENEIIRFFGINKFLDTINKKSLSSKDIYYVKDYLFFTNNGLDKSLVQKNIYISPRKYNIEYIHNDKNRFTEYNEFILFGKDYSKQEETSNGK